MATPKEPPHQTQKLSFFEIFRIFLLLGCTSFGGPVAHLGYFREEFITRRKWLSDEDYADLIAFCQFLPGPASSQVGMAIGLTKGGYRGMFAAWLGFTLPSALLMFLFAFGVLSFGELGYSGWIAGLKAATVAIVAHALGGMVSSLASSAKTATIAVAAMALVFLVSGAWGQILAIVAGGVAGLLWLRREGPAIKPETLGHSAHMGVSLVNLIIFAVLLAVLPLAALYSADIALLDSFYRSGSLVFGGGHVVLPLLQAEMVESGLVGTDDFLAGYGLAQAVPGPLFTFASYLGVLAAPDKSAVTGSIIATVGIFLPSFFLVLGGLPLWNRFRALAVAQNAMMGINAAVVGLVAAVLYTPVFTATITGVMPFLIAVVSYLLLRYWKLPPWALIMLAGIVGHFLL
ncbi:chromate efflux transporter [Emcibacter nanhaiensis]|uniref:Chromate efflux transporter n=1 Tax=Emcibacter nanhaiensis TaxID=1505037 RepID=A0A501PSA4_9PROT|nr:chromate efflux transporter [Emcibacter nanhaiensis]TPD63018.1 chromate efflux transporter [Emcibacter nanhaiensis]